MPIPIIDSILRIGEKLIPDPEKKREFQLELQKLADLDAARAHEETMGQIEVNKIEAAHASVFVSGWRPGIGWVGVVGCATAYVILPIGGMIDSLLHGRTIPAYPIETLMILLLHMLGGSAIRSFDKLKGSAFGSLGGDPGISVTTKKVVPAKAAPAAPTETEEPAPWTK